MLLAHAPADVQEEVPATPQHPHSQTTITDLVRLREMLADIRRNGYAVSNGQITADVLSVGAPISGPDGSVIAAVSMVVPADSAQPGALAPLVRAAARGITPRP